MFLAQGGAGAADFGAFLGQMRVVRRPAQHEVRVHQAHLRAVEQRDQMLCFTMRMAAVHHMRSGLGTETVTGKAVVETLLHFTAER